MQTHHRQFPELVRELVELHRLAQTHPDDSQQLSPQELARLECFALLAKLDDRGLTEAVSSLRDMVEFYAEPPATPPPSPPVRSIEVEVSGSYT